MNDLLKKLQSMGLKIEKGSDIHPEAENKIPIDKVVQGEWLESRGEKIYITRNEYPFGSSHGKVLFKNELRFKNFSQFWRIKNLDTYNLQDFLFIDTETSRLSLGIGSIVFLFGGCYFTEKGLEVIQYFLDDPSNEAWFLATIEDLLLNYKCLVSYNGKSFDIPMLRSRMVLNRMPYGNLNKDHLDLLHFARMMWKLRLESRRLSDIEKEIMDFQRTEEEVPGWLVPQLYQDYLGLGDATPLKGVFYHNEKDIVSLAALFVHINKMISDQETLDSSNSLDIISIGSIYQKSGNLSLSEEFYKLGLDKGLPEGIDYRILKNFAGVMKKQNKWPDAIKLWEMAADMNDHDSCIEIAKYYEHHTKDIYQALVWVEAAIKIVNRTPDTANLLDRLGYRKRRLESKINSTYEK
ncbi:MAG: ribonuclease H-like domain-containing protein [Pelolinea sp.]|nr:ribonuclease H-like domain-containing protein [Pelolinea sp.]